MIKQDVLNYEADVARRENETEGFLEKHDRHNYRYREWGLQHTISRFLPNTPASVKWIGNDQNANLMALFYTLLRGSLHANYQTEDIFLKLKHSLYQDSKEALTLAEQKVFVEHLSLLQYSKDVGEFLKKSTHLEALLIKNFLFKRKQMTRKNFAYSHLESKLSELKWYASFFPFASFQILSEKCARVGIGAQAYFIMEEKECFFVVEGGCHRPNLEAADSSQSSKCDKTPSITTPSITNPSITATSITKINSVERLNFQKKEPTTHTSPKSRSREQSGSREQSNQNTKKATRNNSINQVTEGPPLGRKECFNIIEYIRDIEQNIDRDIEDTNEQLKGNISGHWESHRVRQYGLQVQQTDHISVALREQADFAFKIPDLADESETETVCKGEGTKAGWEKKERSGFIHQSLGANDASAGPGIYHEGIPHHRTNGVPKFLTSKKHETATPTFAVTPSKGSHLKLLMRSKSPESLLDRNRSAQHISVPQLKPLSKLDSGGLLSSRNQMKNPSQHFATNKQK